LATCLRVGLTGGFTCFFTGAFVSLGAGLEAFDAGFLAGAGLLALATGFLAGVDFPEGFRDEEDLEIFFNGTRVLPD
jgi:hypothetical protein